MQGLQKQNIMEECNWMATPMNVIVMPGDNSHFPFNKNGAERYRNIVGIILYVATKSCPDLCKLTSYTR